VTAVKPWFVAVAVAAAAVGAVAVELLTAQWPAVAESVLHSPTEDHTAPGESYGKFPGGGMQEENTHFEIHLLVHSTHATDVIRNHC
jgi:hypothetical protein